MAGPLPRAQRKSAAPRHDRAREAIAGMFGVPSNGRWHSNYGGPMLQFGETARRSDGLCAADGWPRRPKHRHTVSCNQRAGQRLPGARLVDVMLPQRLADALRDDAVTLAVEPWSEAGPGSMESWARTLTWRSCLVIRRAPR